MLRRPPGPKPHFLVGNVPLASGAPLAVFSRWAKEFGDIFYYRAFWLRVYFLNHPELIEAVLVRNPRNFLKDRVVRNSKWFFGQGLLTNEGEAWLRQRHLAQPAFHRERIASYAKIMVDCARRLVARWRPGETRDVHHEMMQLTFGIVVRCLFQVEPEAVGEISSALNLLMRNATGARMLFPPLVRHLPTPTMIEVRRAVKKLDDTVYGILAVRRRQPSDTGDLLSMLIQARDEAGTGMTDRQLRDEVMTFLLAGHETTALALSWAWHLIAQHPAIEEKLQAEIAQVLGERPADFTDLAALGYAERLIKESMRLYPPAWSLARTVISDIELGGYVIPAGANVVMSQWIMHRDSRFFPNPEDFDPDRWTGSQMQRLPRFAYFPFGGGPRQCIGASFAMMEAVLLLVTIAQQFRLRSLPGHAVVPVPGFTLRPKLGLPMTLHSRTSLPSASPPRMATITTAN